MLCAFLSREKPKRARSGSFSLMTATAALVEAGVEGVEVLFVKSVGGSGMHHRSYQIKKMRGNP